MTYVVQVGLHVDQSESLFEKHNEHAAGDPVLIKAVFMHVRFLRKHERGVFKACTDAQIKVTPRAASTGALAPRLASHAHQCSVRDLRASLAQ